MKFKAEEWTGVCQGLDEASTHIQDFREDGRRDHLSLAVWHLWRFAEYAINAVLELEGEPPERKHQIAIRAASLHASGTLGNAYEDVLDKLERYRLKADYGSYSSAPSTHYSAPDVERCRVDVQRLREEVEQLLQQRGWWP